MKAKDREPDPPCEPPNHAELCASSTSLLQAATDDCPDRTRELLATHGIDSQDGRPSSALAAAVRTGHETVALLLIKAGAPVNPAGADFLSDPLFLAAHRKDDRGNTLLLNEGVFKPGLSKILLDAGVDPNVPGEHGVTPLMLASQYGYEEEIKLLLEHHADVNLKDAKRRTALMYAAGSQYGAAIPILLAHGADPLWRDDDGLTALDLAKKSGNDVAVQLLSAPESRAVPNSIH